MAEFCRSCAKDLEGTSDFVGIPPNEVVLCEGCGPIQVGPDGDCVSADCLLKDTPNHGAHNQSRMDEQSE